MWSWATFGWGILGGVFAYALAFVLPELRSLAEKGQPQARFTWRRIGGFIGLFAFYVLAAGFVAVWLGGASSNWKQSIAFGMSWEVVAKGIGSEVRRIYLSTVS